ncbi:MAG: cation:proton antiporter [Planctomycetota bacterium]
MTHHLEITNILLQIVIVLISAKLLGLVVNTFLKIPSLLGELLAGVLIAPANFAGIKGHIFTELFSPESEYFVILKVLSEIGVFTLLFYSGLETDKQKFFKYFFTAFIIGLGGVITPFIMCSTYIYYWLKLSNHPYTIQEILFCGAIATATSVGITVTILLTFNKLDTVFGTAIMVAAVIDDVLGLIVLSVVSSISGTTVDIKNIANISLKALGAWICIGGISFLLVYFLNRIVIDKVNNIISFCLAISLAFLAGYLCEKVKLSAIVGTYVVGLAISQTQWAKKIHHITLNIVEFLIPFFFFKIGLLIQLNLFGSVIGSGIIFTLLALFGKFIGCGLPAFLLRINLKDSILVGTGMAPRGEVGLIIAYIALEKNIIEQKIYNIAVFMVFFSTIVAVIILSYLIKKFTKTHKGLVEVA